MRIVSIVFLLSAAITCLALFGNASQKNTKLVSESEVVSESEPISEHSDTVPCPCATQAAALEDREANTVSDLQIPDVELLDQDGNKVRFYSDLVKDKVVAINFFFTTCTTICPPLTANFASLQQRMLEAGHEGDFQMISISVDPRTDTPPRLKAWSKKFNAQPGWTFLTGDKQTVDRLLKALKVFTPLKEDHSPTVLIGDERQNNWTRVYGLGSPAEMAQVLTDAIQSSAQSSVSRLAEEITPRTGSPCYNNAAARQYFSDVELVNQHGDSVRFYSDLIQGKCVIINCFFTECGGVCPVIHGNLRAIQDSLGDRLGRDVYILSISVDPTRDTPQQLAAYAEHYQAKPGWFFLTGKQEQVDIALGKLGFKVAHRESHSPVLLVGNDKTGFWKKALGLSSSEQLIPIIQEVVNDEGPEAAPQG